MDEKITMQKAIEIAKERDCACVCCQSKKDLHGHHVLPKNLFPEYANDPNNIVALCRDCHISPDDSYHSLYGKFEECNLNTFIIFLKDKKATASAINSIKRRIEKIVFEVYGVGIETLLNNPELSKRVGLLMKDLKIKNNFGETELLEKIEKMDKEIDKYVAGIWDLGVKIIEYEKRIEELESECHENKDEIIKKMGEVIHLLCN